MKTPVAKRRIQQTIVEPCINCGQRNPVNVYQPPQVWHCATCSMRNVWPVTTPPAEITAVLAQPALPAPPVPPPPMPTPGTVDSKLYHSHTWITHLSAAQRKILLYVWRAHTEFRITDPVVDPEVHRRNSLGALLTAGFIEPHPDYSRPMYRLTAVCKEMMRAIAPPV